MNKSSMVGSSMWWLNKDYLIFSEIINKSKKNKYSEKELSDDFLKLCDNIEESPSDKMFEFMNEKLPSAKISMFTNRPILCVYYFDWLCNDSRNKKLFIDELESCIDNNYKNIPYTQIIYNKLVNANSDVVRTKKLIKIYLKLYNLPDFNINGEIILQSGFDGKFHFAVGNFPSFIFKKKKEIILLEEGKGESKKFFFDLYWKKIYEAMNKIREIKLDWNIKKLLIIAFKNQKGLIGKLPKDIIKIIISLLSKRLEQPVTDMKIQTAKGDVKFAISLKNKMYSNI